MKKKIIGIPRAFLYYRYNYFWSNYFKLLGYKVKVSPLTTNKILELGKKYSVDESCLSSKIFIGHVIYLIDKCDYILVPRICNYGKEEKVCVKFNANYDIIKNILPNINIIDYNVENTNKSLESISLIKLGFKLTKRPFKTIISYIQAKNISKKKIKTEIESQKKVVSNNNKKILIISHPYNIYDNYIGKPIINLIKKYNVDIIYSDKLDRKKAKKYAKKLSPTLYWTYSKEAIGSILYYKDIINGIIFITSFPCGPDSLVNELMLRKITNTPTINILIDELSSPTGLETRIESFIDIISERSDING